MSLAILATTYFVVAVGLVIAIDQLVAVMYGERRASYRKTTDSSQQTQQP